MHTYLDGQPRPLGDWLGSLVQDQREASGLLFRRNRYYDPATGQFTQQDPIGIAGGMNLYGFANGDPVNFSDPFGLCPECEDYWLEYAAGGLAQGGAAGTLKAVVGVGAATGLEFFGVNDLWRAGSQAAEGRHLAATGSLLLAVGGMIPGERVASNLGRTLKSAQGTDVAVTAVGNLFKATWEVAGEGGGQSRTVRTKIINSQGETVRMFHDSYDRAGRF
jgi:RHS repeat-associated protein